MDSSLKSKRIFTPEEMTVQRGGRFSQNETKSYKRVTKTASPRGEFKLCTNYETMFSDTRPRSRMQMVTQYQTPASASQSGKLRLKAVQDMRNLMEVQGSHRTLFYRQPSKKHVSSYSTVVVDLGGSPKKVSFGSESDPSLSEGMSRKEKSVVIQLPVKSEKMTSKETQTDYRESEAQTLPWKHEIKAEGKILKELLSLEWFTSERNFPPGEEEATLIERARQKLAWENVMEKMRGRENESKRKSLVLRMAAAETTYRESKIDKENQERMEISKRQMKEAAERFQEKLLFRLQRSYSCRRVENKSKVDYWNHQLRRKIRKMKTARDEKREKSDIITIHLNKTSELYAPKLRDGENPSLGHEIIDIQCRYLKRFHGLIILEKYLTGVLHPKVQGFDFREASKPKTEKLCLKKFRQKVVGEAKEEASGGLTLKIPVPAPTPEESPPQTTRPVSDSEEDLFQASLLLTRLIRGRAVQTKKFLEYYKMAPE